MNPSSEYELRRAKLCWDGLRIVSANLFSGNDTPDKALGFLQQCDADVIAVYEVTPAWDQRLY